MDSGIFINWSKGWTYKRGFPSLDGRSTATDNLSEPRRDHAGLFNCCVAFFMLCIISL